MLRVYVLLSEVLPSWNNASTHEVPSMSLSAVFFVPVLLWLPLRILLGDFNLLGLISMRPSALNFQGSFFLREE